MDDRCSRWLSDLASLMNLPDQDLIPEARDSLVKEGPLRVASHPLAPSSPRGDDYASGSGGTQEALLLALSATPFKIAQAEKIRSRECKL